MSCFMHGAETIMIKNQFLFLMTRINICFNISFLNFDLYFKRQILGNFRSYGLAFVPKCYQYSWCNQKLICFKYMYFGGLHNERQILLSNYNHLISSF